MPSLRSLVALPLMLLAVVPVFAEEPAKKSLPELIEQARSHTSLGDWAKSIPIWREIVERNPTDGGYWLALGTAQRKTGHFREAAETLAKAFELRTGYPANAAYDVACCFAQLGDKAEALHWLETALKAGFRNLAQAQTDEDLASLRDDPKYRDLVLLVDVSKLSRDEGWRHDLKVADREIRRLHFNPYREFSREQFDAYVRKLHDDIPKLTDDQITASFIRLARMAGDGHTHLRPVTATLLPLQLFQFEEGVFVTAVAPEHADLAGAQVLKVGGHPIDEALKTLDPLISRDNAMGVKVMGPHFLTLPVLLNGVGLLPDGERVTYTVRDSAGKERDVTLKGTPGAPGHGPRDTKGWVSARRGAALPNPLYLKNRQTNYWFEYLPEQKLVYFQYNGVGNQGKETLEQFCNRLFKFIDDNDVDRLVIDARWNGGGNSFLNRPIIHGLIRSTKINQTNKLFVIVGRNTFSAAQNCVTDIEMHTKAIFAGEPTGSCPNFIGESVRFGLPYSKMYGTISDLYWVRSWPMDYRPWISPRLYAPPTFALFKENRDPAMEAILAHIVPAAKKAATP